MSRERGDCGAGSRREKAQDPSEPGVFQRAANIPRVKVPVYAEERILFGLVLGGGTWVACRHVAAMAFDPAITYTVLMGLLGAVLGARIFKVAIGASVVADAADGKLSAFSKSVLENKEEYLE